MRMVPDSILRHPAQRVRIFSEPLRQLAQDLIDTMYAYDGIGLAAPQIGESLAVFVANPSKTRGQELVIANPVLTAPRGRLVETEGCLSIPQLWARVRRAQRLRLSGQGLMGESIDVDVQGLLAITCQHEVDHLQGTLFIDRLLWFERRRLRRQLAEPRACG